MKHTECPPEEKVLEAVRSGDWEESLRSHVHQCVSCEEIASTAEWMQSLAASAESESPLPDPELVWLKAQISRQQASRERRVRFVKTSIQGVAATIVTVGLYWTWNRVQSVLNDLAAGVSSLSETLESYPGSFVGLYWNWNTVQSLLGDLTAGLSSVSDSMLSYPGSLVLGSLVLALLSILLSGSVAPDLDRG